MRRTLLALLFTGCGGTGDLSLTTWGEDFIEKELPSSAFEDGYSVRYSKFLVLYRDFTLATKTGTKGPTQQRPYVVDVTKPGPLELEKFEGVQALKWDAVSYGIGPASDAVGVGGIAAADVEAMKSAGASVWVEGTVSKGAVSKTFSWKFDLDTHYEHCTNPDFGEGATVPTGGTEVVQLTVHGDHLWYDDLQSDTAKVRGQAMVDADRDADGVITQAELQAVQLTSLPLGQYGTGGASRVKTLYDFVRVEARTVGHYRGEGECDAVAR
jgi:hypothetical protein